MSRLLHAAARGARIQTLFKTEWVRAAYIPTADYTGDDPRIHPEDEHLQYGPISTALRQMGLTGTCDDGDIPYVKIGLLREDCYWSSTKEQRHMFCLLLAEALADEGL